MDSFELGLFQIGANKYHERFIIYGLLKSRLVKFDLQKIILNHEQDLSLKAEACDSTEECWGLKIIEIILVQLEFINKCALKCLYEFVFNFRF